MKLYFATLLLLVSCFQDFDNPIDPFEKGLPGKPSLRDATPINEKRAVTLLVDYDYDRADAVVVFRSDAGKGFLPIDTLEKNAGRTIDSLDLQWDTNYAYHLRSLNRKGLSGISNEKSVSIDTEPVLEVGDTSRPSIVFLEGDYAWNSDNSALIVSDSTHLLLQLSGTVSDDAGIDSLAVNGVPTAVDPVSGAWSFGREITEYRTSIIVYARDKSDAGNIGIDTIDILFDYRNSMPDSVRVVMDGSDALLSWKGNTDPDFREFTIRVADGSIPDLSSLPVGSTTETSFRYTPSGALGARTSFTLSLVDSLGNEIHTYAMLGDAVMDSRDAQVYDSVGIGTQTWLAANLNYDPGFADESWCYDEVATNCNSYGRLYMEKAISGADSAQYRIGNSTRGLCPMGFHLPSDEDWDILVQFVATDQYTGVTDSVAYALYSTSDWTGGPYGGDLYGFNLLPGGYKIQQYSPAGFSGSGFEAWFWMQKTNFTFRNPKNYLRTYPNTGSYRIDYDYAETSNAYMAYSVRCLKD